MASSRAALCAAAAALLALLACASAQSPCAGIPTVGGVDQSATSPADYGKCLKTQSWFHGTHWCKFGKLGTWPAPPSGKAQTCLKFGRSTIYRGPIYGSSAQHKAACNRVLRGNDNFAMVAVSTKYLKTHQGGWTADQGACHKCMCIRMHGADNLFNPGVQKDLASQRIGLTFLGKVGDRCSECPDDQIDILQDRPFSWAPYDPKVKKNNPNAVFVNAKDGLRGFSEPDAMRGTGHSPEAVGTWNTNWQFVPCEGWSHEKCAGLMKDMGFDKVFTPSKVDGVDSNSLRPMATLRTAPFGPDPMAGNDKDRK